MSRKKVLFKKWSYKVYIKSLKILKTIIIAMHVHSKSNRTVQMILKNKVIYMFFFFFSFFFKESTDNSEVKCTDMRFTARINRKK